MPLYLSLPLGLAGAALFLFVLYCLSVRPGHRAAAIPFLATDYAHRGLHDGARPENSLPAFAAACAHGYGIELDVQLSKDGVAMVFHDPTLLRMCGKEGCVCDYTAAELGALSLAGTAHGIPTFAAVLETVGGRVPLLVEIKCYGAVAPVCEAAANLLDRYGGPYMIESFHPFALNWFRKNRPGVVRGQLSARLCKEGSGSFGAFLVQALCMNFITRPDFIAFSLVDRHLLSFRLARGLWRGRALAWTVKSAGAQAEAKADFDAVIFEDYLPEGKGGEV